MDFRFLLLVLLLVCWLTCRDGFENLVILPVDNRATMCNNLSVRYELDGINKMKLLTTLHDANRNYSETWEYNHDRKQWELVSQAEIARNGQL